MKLSYDIVVIGAGHAGCEAASAAARLGSRTLLITIDMEKIASMSCNPAVGGVAKGQIVREIDALGGRMARITDMSAIQFRMLNRSKGAAMWSPRAQCDKAEFSRLWRRELENTPNLYIWQDSVTEILMDHSGEKVAVRGVKTRMGVEIECSRVVLTAGTFLSGLMHCGDAQAEGGRAGDQASYGITEQLRSLGFEAGRMKTGTPARLDARTINFDALEIQEGDAVPSKFSYDPDTEAVKHQLPCFMVYTSKGVHDILRTGFERSPLFNGTIHGIGPRYCPSIEDKLRTFADKEQHQLFLEPEGRNTNEYYLNGFSSSLPYEVQLEALHNIVGLEDVHVYRPGYAIEYDYFPPTQLNHTLETKLVEGLYSATYPGANAQEVADSVATPIELQLSGIQGMDYINSTSSNNGNCTLNVIFEPGTDANTNQQLTYMKYSQATSQLPETVSKMGITIKQSSGLPMMLYAIDSPKDMSPCNSYLLRPACQSLE